MKTFIGGNLTNTTAAVQSFLAAGNQYLMRDLYLIGDVNDPTALFLTNHESALTWNFIQQPFQPARIERGSITTSIGFDAETLSMKWTPSGYSSGQTVATADYRTLARLGYYDNRDVRVWRTIMPTPGDANTYGAAAWWGGRIADVTVDRGQIEFSINSYLDCLDSLVPVNIISNQGTMAAFSGAAPPPGFSVIPYFDVFTGSTNTVIYGDVLSPYSTGHIFSNNVFQRGYLVFIPGPGSTLQGFYSAIAQNLEFTDGHSNNHNAFTLYTPMPWPPAAYSAGSGDQFYVSAPPPVTQTEAAAAGTDYTDFPYVPAAETAF
jgi:hypothetical protein